MIKFFQNDPEILALMSEKADGSMKLFSDSDINKKNREIFFGKSFIDKKIIAAEIVHGSEIQIVDAFCHEFIKGADGLITKDKNVFLAITVADCIPVFIYEPKSRIFGIAHCGWRSIVSGIIDELLQKAITLGCEAQNIKLVLGPGINKCHFEIQQDVLGEFENHLEFVEKRKNKLFVDLKGIIKKRFLENGGKIENIENNDECTFELPQRYFSFRRDKPQKVEAMVAIIGRRS